MYDPLATGSSAGKGDLEGPKIGVISDALRLSPSAGLAKYDAGSEYPAGIRNKPKRET